MKKKDREDREGREGHLCVNPNTCDICNGIVSAEELRDDATMLRATISDSGPYYGWHKNAPKSTGA